MTELVRFTVDQVVSATSACDSDCTWWFTVTARTARFVTLLEHGTGDTHRVKVREHAGEEWASPFGTYSMAPVVRAGEVVVDPPVGLTREAQADVADVVEVAKCSIALDVLEGVVPADVASFADLHDHVDANGYVSMAYALHGLAGANAAAAELDAWLIGGRR